MERDEILKLIGFSDKFIQSLHEYEQAVPDIYYELPFKEDIIEFEMPNSFDEVIIDQTSATYNQNIIIYQ